MSFGKSLSPLPGSLWPSKFRLNWSNNKAAIEYLVGVWTNPTEKYARQIGSFPQVGLNIKNIWNHHLDTLQFQNFNVSESEPVHFGNNSIHVNFMFYQLQDVYILSDHVHHVHGLKIFQDLVIIQCGYIACNLCILEQHDTKYDEISIPMWTRKT